MSKKGKVVIAILIILVLALGGLSTYLFLNKDNSSKCVEPKKEVKEEKEEQEEKEEPKEESGEESEKRVVNNKTQKEQIDELAKLFKTESDAEYKMISREEAQKLVDEKLPKTESPGMGCEHDYSFYTYKEYLIAMKTGGCFYDGSITVYGYGHEVEYIDNLYTLVFSKDIGESVEATPIVKDGYLYYMIAISKDIESPVFLCKINLENSDIELVDMYDLQHSME